MKDINLFDLSSHAMKLYFLLFSYADEQGVCWPSQLTLMKNLKMSRLDTLKKTIEELKNHNLVTYKMQLSKERHYDAKNRKYIPIWQTKYFIESDKMQLSTKEGIKRINLETSSRDLRFAILQNATRIYINNINSKNPHVSTTAEKELTPPTEEEIRLLALEMRIKPGFIKNKSADLQDYIVDHPGKYKDFNRTLRNWLRRDLTKNPGMAAANEDIDLLIATSPEKLKEMDGAEAKLRQLGL